MSYSIDRWFLLGATAFAFVAAGTPGIAQQTKSGKRAVATPITATVLPEAQLTRAELEAHLRFIASDELQGRRTGSPGNMVAARYIAEQFRQIGLKPVADNNSYYQTVALQRTQPTASGTIRFGTDSLSVGKQFVVVAGGAANQMAESVYVGYGLTADDYAGKDVKGKFVITQVGSAEAKSPRDLISAMTAKRKLASERGAIGIIELFASPATPWTFANRFFNSEQISIPTAEAPGQTPILHIWADNGKGQLAGIKDNRSVTVRTSGRSAQPLNAVNVAGVVEGTDPTLKSEYVLLTAHYDHIGTAKAGVGSVTAADTIYNGARDNGMGTVGLIAAAKTLMAQRPKRSVIIVALTGEEVGLLGSRYYAEHPLVPLKQTIFNFNIDGAGYNDTKLISVIGLERTGAKAEIEQAAAQFGLSVFAEPAPEQGLFDRSDNVSFAAKGVPAPTLSEGFKAFDEELMKNYHQVSDNPDTIDYDYLLKFCQSYARAARLIADRNTRPFWIAGDKYEAAGKALYGQ
ncbi:M28 family peptidase [Fibrella forsythiae]|uniref:M28 family peptidase n=1 Tax=Fibrella forsythiae TaxID=2817061 RepID=A0ABS3JJ09_9BACT|nr:M28 family peptidase [Fibrella forsythiae]MBO0948857.1 M28 family peptidase [Fibrella forsythiae]